MQSDLLNALFGALGSIIYAFPVFMTSKTEQSFERSANLGYAIFVGAVFGGVLTDAVGAEWQWTVKPTSYPLAVGVGLLANPLTPLIIDRGKAFFNLAADVFSGRFSKGN